MSILRLPCLLLCTALIFFSRQNTMGELRYPAPDPDLVQGSDLIVVAHVKADSIAKIPNPHPEYLSPEYSAILIVVQVIKGKCESATLPVLFRDGMEPCFIDENGGRKGFSDGKAGPKSRIVLELQDDMSFLLPGDLMEDHLWFLRCPPSPAPANGAAKGPLTPSVSNPEQFQPLELRPYFEALLTSHPEDILKKYVPGTSPLAVRSQTHLNHLAVQQIIKEPDLQKRAQLLLPYFLYTDEKQKPLNYTEAEIQLYQGCKTTGAALLVPYFKDPKYREMKCDIMYVWAYARYRDCIPLLVDALEEETRFWQGQTAEQRDLWIHGTPNHYPTQEQRASMRRMEMIFFVFHQVDDPRAKAEIAKVSPLWKQMFPPRSLDQTIREGLMLPER